MKKLLTTFVLLFTVLFMHAQTAPKAILGKWKSVGIQYFNADGTKKGRFQKSTKDDFTTYSFNSGNNCSTYSENGEMDGLQTIMNYTVIGKHVVFYQEKDGDYFYVAQVKFYAKGKEMELMRNTDEDYYYIEYYQRMN